MLEFDVATGESCDASSSDGTAMRVTSARLIESSTSSVKALRVARPAAALLCAHIKILAMNIVAGDTFDEASRQD
jgi:hypothetical protein